MSEIYIIAWEAVWSVQKELVLVIKMRDFFI
jgi:hypothetical protein